MKIKYTNPKGKRFNRYFRGTDQRLFHEKYGNMTFAYYGDIVFDAHEQNRLLHDGKACVYTDKRYGGFSDCPRWWLGNTTKAFKRICGNFTSLYDFPITIRRWNRYRDGGTIIYTLKPSKEKPKFNLDDYCRVDDINDKWLKELVIEMKAQGFIVKGPYHNDSFIMTMVGGESDMGGQHITAYGHGKRVGISSGNDSYRGYSYGEKSVLWDWCDEFDKWSRCNEILKTTPINEIIEQLVEIRTDES